MTAPASQHDPQVKPIAALLYREADALEDAVAALEAAYSPLDLRGEPRPFDHTDFYAEEMGAGLQRLLVSFTRLERPGWLVEAKHAAQDVEDALRTREADNRRVNVDVGYVDLGKVVLASWKERPHKLYTARGVWADLMLTYADGAWQPLPWTFPDFREGVYDADLHAIRDRYKTQLRDGLLPPD